MSPTLRHLTSIYEFIFNSITFTTTKIGKIVDQHANAYSEPCQIFMRKCLAEIVNCFLPLTIFSKRSFLDILQGSGYASEHIIASASRCW